MKKVLILVCFFLTILSCENLENENLSPLESLVIEDSKLVFENEDSFWKFYGDLKNKGKKQAESEKKIADYNSFYLKNKQELNEKQKLEIVKNGGSDIIYLLSNEEGEIEAVSQIEDEVLQKIADEKGLVYFGKDAIKFERERKIFFKGFSIEKLEKFKKGIKDKDIQISSTKKLRVAALNSALPDNDSRHNYFRSDLRLKSRYNYKDGFLVGYWDELEVTAELQDRFAGIWWNRVADAISVTSTAVDGTYNGLNQSNKANWIFYRSYYSGSLLFCFQKDFSHTFNVRAWCSENNGQYVGEIYVYR